MGFWLKLGSHWHFIKLLCEGLIKRLENAFLVDFDLKEGEDMTLLTQIEDLSLKAKNRSEQVPSIKSSFYRALIS